MLNHAIDYLRRGWSVIPVVAGGKSSPIKWKEYQTRHATEDEIRAWFKKWPDCNIAIITGAISGLIVLDVDGAEGQESARDKALPPTMVSSTGKGAHYYYKHPGVFVTGQVRFLPGMDIRGDGNYVVAPPSLHSSGAIYEWRVKEDLIEAPDWLLEVVNAKARKESKRPQTSGVVELADHDIGPGEWYEGALEGMVEGERNKMATRLVGRWAHAGMTPREAWFMLESWNRNNKPPAPEDELHTTLESVYRIEAQSKMAAALAEGADPTQYGQADPGVLCQTLSDALGLHVKRIIKYKAEPPRYIVEVNDAKIDIDGVEELIDYKRFRKNVAAYCNVIIPKFKAPVWERMTKTMLRALEEVEVGEEGGRRSSVKASLLHYLREQQPITDETAIEGERPFYWHGVLYVKSVPFRLYLKRVIQETYSPITLAAGLRSLGCVQSQVWYMQRKVRTNTRCWKMPPAVIEELKPQQEESK
jgi:hypothetical protein